MGFMDRIIDWSLNNRLFVVVSALALTFYGGYTAFRMPVDVFPDLTAPTVTIMTEAHGLAPEEVESLVTIPIESVVNGATSVRRVRSSSSVGYSIVWVEFEWDTDIYTARQIVGEKLQLARSQIPPDLGPPTLAPISSIMGEILFLGLASDKHSPMEVRETADWVIRKRLLAIPGVAQVIPIGGEVKQFQVQVNPLKLRAMGVSFEEVMSAIAESNGNSSGGFLVDGAQESLIRGLGRIGSQKDIESIVVAVKDSVPVQVGQLAKVTLSPAIKRGEGSANAKPAVIMAVLKQPRANTLELTRRIDAQLDQIETTLPGGMTIERQLFRQSDFIETAVSNVSVALRDGAILVVVILFLFLFNFRTTLISLAALPVSPEVAPRMFMCSPDSASRYSKRLPRNCRATSLKARVGPWNSSMMNRFSCPGQGTRGMISRWSNPLKLSRTNPSRSCCGIMAGSINADRMRRQRSV